MQVVASSSTVTTMEGWLPDQAALKGVLDTLYELRLCLEEVTCLGPPGMHCPASHSGKNVRR
jgi:hypothetical protein